MPFDFDGELVSCFSFLTIFNCCLLLVNLGAFGLTGAVAGGGAVVACFTCFPHCEKLLWVACLGMTNFCGSLIISDCRFIQLFIIP